MSFNHPTRPLRLAFAAIFAAWMCIIALGCFARLNYGLEDDELQHLHMAWRIGQGDLPYRDFFEHHPPLAHFVLAPFVRSFHTFAETPLAQLRAAEAVVLGLLVFLCYRVLRRTMPPVAAAWGGGLFLIGSSFAPSYYEFRPDWAALLCLVGIVLLLANRSNDIDERSAAATIGAGLLAGVASCLTQKAWFLLVAIVLWMGVSALLGPLDARSRRWRRLVTFLCASAVPLLAMWGYFAARGAGWQTINDNIFVNFRWPRERRFYGYIRATTPSSAGLLALGAIAIFSTVRNWRQELRSSSVRGLITTIALFGTLSYVLTPVPYEQSYLFLACFWFGLLAADLLWQIIEQPQRWRGLGFVLGFLIVAMSVLPKEMSNRLMTVVSWLLVLVLLWVACWKTSRLALAARAAIAIGAVSAIGLLWIIREDIYSIRYETRGVLQMQNCKILDDRLGPDGQLITLWPAALPFRRHATFFPFGHEPMLQLFYKDVEPQYLEALAKNGTTLVVGYDEQLSARFLPRFKDILRTEFRPIKLPCSPIVCDAYERIPANSTRSDK